MIQVTLPFLTLTNEIATDPRLLDIPGWYDGSTPKNPIEERPQSHGAWDTGEPLYSAKEYAVIGAMSVRDPVAVFQVREQVMAHLELKDPFDIEVADPLGARTASVRLTPGREPTFAIDDESGVATFQVPLLARDPRRYGPTASVSNTLPSSGTGMTFPFVFPAEFGTPGNDGRVITSNPGTAETVSLFEVTGGLTGGFSLISVEDGRELRLERDIPDGSTVYLNPRTAAVYIDAPGNDISGSLTKREWWTVPAGSTRTVQFAALGATSGTPTLTARTAPAYW